MVRGLLMAVVAVSLGVAGLLSGCTRGDVEVVKFLPDPLLKTQPDKPTVQSKPKVAVAAQPKRTGPKGEYGWVPPGGISKRWQCIVVHHSGTSAGCASDFHQAHLNRGWDELGYHFVIGNGTGSSDGQIEVGSRWYKQKHGAHCKTAGNWHNEHGIGICMVGNFEQGRPSARQLASLDKLVKFLMAKTGIPAGSVIGHREAPGTSTLCPGSNTPIARIRANLRDYRTASSF